MKQTAKIDEWSIQDLGQGVICLIGKVKDHPKQSSFHEEFQRTSQVLNIDFVDMSAETLNTYYILLNPQK